LISVRERCGAQTAFEGKAGRRIDITYVREIRIIGSMNYSAATKVRSAIAGVRWGEKRRGARNRFACAAALSAAVSPWAKRMGPESGILRSAQNDKKSINFL
jgi:hypothetical protein